MQEVSEDVLLEKYAKKDEKTEHDIFKRVAKGIAKAEKPNFRKKWEKAFYENMVRGAIGAGRIMSAGGSNILATLMNCYVIPVSDSIKDYDEDGDPGIYIALTESAETMRRGGGVGYNFSKIRPKGAKVGSVGSLASGPCSYMNIFDSSCKTVESAGERRGAQMGILNINHPDIEEFVKAKRTEGRWNNFNVSVYVTDEFMNAKNNNLEIELVHKAEPSEGYFTKDTYQRADGMWVYKKINALELWDTILKSNYDYAEPGILFRDTINGDNNLWYCETLDATNPCVTSDTWIMTDNGASQVKDLIGQSFNAIVDGKPYKTISNGFFSTGIKDVYKLITEEGFEVRLTEDHRVLKISKQTRDIRETEWVAAKDLKQEDKIVLNNHLSLNTWNGKGTEEEGYLLGLLIGDGWINDSKAVVSVWETNVPNGTMGVMLAAEDAAFTLPHREDFIGFQKRTSCNSNRMSSKAIFDLAVSMGVTKDNKTITPEIEKASSDFNIGLIRGLFDTDGSVQGNHEKGVSLRLSQSNLKLLLAAQRILLRFGIVSKVYANRRDAEKRLLPDGKGDYKYYECKASHELIISKSNLFTYNEKIGFSDTENSRKIKELLEGYKRTPNKESFTATVFALVKDTTEEVFDVTVDQVHAFDGNGLMLHNCAEEPLPKYGCCDLGPIILSKFVKNPFTPQASFDFDSFIASVKIQTRFLDNVLDVTYWPLEQQKKESDSKRRIGIGFTALANTLAMLNLKYNKQDGLDMAKKIAEEMRNAAYIASVDLAIEKGRFPLFHADKYLKPGTFASRLPEEIKEGIRKYGLRNSHLLSIAPTGTVSLAFADNASNGIEPPFSLAYKRKKRLTGDDNWKTYNVVDHSVRVYLSTLEDQAFANSLQEAICNYKTEFTYNDKVYLVSENIPDTIITAQDLTAEEHLKILEVVQPFIDTSISKTVNVPVECTFEDFKNIYDIAWVSKLKGVSTYRPNPIVGSVLSLGTSTPEATETPVKAITVQDVDPNAVVISKRPSGRLQSVTDKIQYHGHNGDYTLYVGVSFMNVKGIKDGVEFVVERPIEIFINASPSSVPVEWVTTYARTMSLIARSGLALFTKALQDNRSIASGKHQIRYDWHYKADGTKVPRHHDSDVAVISYAIQNLLKERGILNESGNIAKTKVNKTGVLVENKVIEQKVETVQVNIIPGKICTECGAAAVIKRDGCSYCTACSALGECG